MNECCEISNPLRRDGTSQPQRFPKTLAEDYVRIDERSSADLLNFTLRLAQEFNFYNGSDTLDGSWVEFFKDDHSFLLAQISQLDLQVYKKVFLDRLALVQVQVEAGDEALAAPLLGNLIQFFLLEVEISTGPSVALAPFTYLMDQWYELLPESAYFEGAVEYAFKDELGEARNKLRSFLGSIQTAHYEAENQLAGVPAINDDWYRKLHPEWGVNSTPDPAATGYEMAFFIHTEKIDSIKRVLETLTASFETFLGVLKALQNRVPIYLEQSLKEFPYHNPQNGLFLAFLHLFGHAQDHINTLGRKHLLHYYKDVLRFSEQALVPDQAAVVVQLRKGIERHLIEKGVLLKAGNDPDGNPRFYETIGETVVNQAKIESIKTIFVESDLRIIEPTLGGSSTDDRLEKRVVRGLWAAPIANSADGQGAELDEGEPKWNTFGEAQSGKLPAQRTMLDARIGFAIASPALVMKEGKREVFLTLYLDKDGGANSPLDPYLFQNMTKSERYQAEAEILAGLNAEYTGEKGWENAWIDCVFVAAESAHLVGHQSAESEFGLEDFDFSKWMVLCIKVNLFEYNSPAIPFSSDLHEGKFTSSWPIFKFSFRSSSFGFSKIDLVNLSDNTLPQIGSLGLYEGAVYEYVGPRSNGEMQWNAGEEEFEFEVENEGLKSSTKVSAVGTNTQAGQKAIKKAFGSSNQLAHYSKWDALESPVILLEEGPYNKPKPVLPRGASPVLVEAGKGLGGDFKRILDQKVLLAAKYTQYDEGKTYSKASKVYFRGGVFVSNTTVCPGESPEVRPDKWEFCNFSTCIYNLLENCHPQFINVQVKVSGVQEVLLENDLGRLKPGKPFEPFGSAPVVGSRFYIGSQEIFGKRLDDLSLVIDWEDPPSDLGDHYSAYNSLIPGSFNNGRFKAKAAFLADGLWKSLPGEKSLFRFQGSGYVPGGAKAQNTINLKSSVLSGFERDLNLEEPKQYKANAVRGFLRLELSNPPIAFGHAHYQDLYVDAVLDVSNSTMSPAPEPEFPGLPYTPTIKGFQINYASSELIDLREDSQVAFENRVDQFFHLHPFGHTEEHPYLWQESKGTLIPTYAAEGYLYMGIDKLDLPSTLSVLFQLSEGSADPELVRYEPVWSILSNNRWRDLEPAQVVLDSSGGLISSGVIQFDLSKEMTAGDSLIESGMRWLRAKVDQNTAAIHKAIDIQSQAILVSFSDQGSNPEHLRTALEGQTISALKTNDPKVKKVKQPYSSFGGKMPEQSNEFLTRVSERLRHKYRSINIWDYERMVLEEFPSVYKVKCCNHTWADISTGSDLELAPGNVTVVTIPDLRNVNAVNPFEPKTPLHILENIKRFLEGHVTGWVDLQVTNPLYEQVTISCDIGFQRGRDPGYYITQLDTDLKQFLSPWAFDSSEEIVFGGKIHRSLIINFIEQRDYVDFVVNFRMSQRFGDGEVLENAEEAVARTSRSILVSSLQHQIGAVIEKEENCLAVEVGKDEKDGNCCGKDKLGFDDAESPCDPKPGDDDGDQNGGDPNEGDPNDDNSGGTDDNGYDDNDHGGIVIIGVTDYVRFNQIIN